MKIKRSFAPGDEWLYYKLYGGIESLDHFLKQGLQLFLEKNKLTDRYFFIRYRDPDYHIRFRILIEGHHAGDLMASFNSYVKSHLDNGTIRNIGIHTYTREIERYQGILISFAEKLFMSNSNVVIHFLRNFTQEYRYLFGLVYADRFLDYFKLSDIQKQDYTEILLNAFKTEFSFDKTMQVQMDMKYRSLGKQYLEFVSKGEDETYQKMVRIIDSSLDQLDDDIAFILSKSAGSMLTSFISSILHMHFNRLYRTNQRQSEFVSYYILNKSYISIRKRKS